MTCEQLLAYLSDYLDHELDEAFISAAQDHLATCQHCLIVLHTTQRVILLGQGQHQRTIPTAQRERLFARLQVAFLGQPGALSDDTDQEP